MSGAKDSGDDSKITLKQDIICLVFINQNHMEQTMSFFGFEPEKTTKTDEEDTLQLVMSKSAIRLYTKENKKHGLQVYAMYVRCSSVRYFIDSLTSFQNQFDMKQLIIFNKCVAQSDLNSSLLKDAPCLLNPSVDDPLIRNHLIGVENVLSFASEDYDAIVLEPTEKKLKKRKKIVYV